MLGFFKKKKKKKKKKKEEKKNQQITEVTGPIDASDPEEDKSTKKSSDNQSSKSDASAGMMKAAMGGMLGGGGGDITEMLKNIDTSGMSLKEKMSLKMLQKLPKKKQEEVLRQALSPEELYKNKDVVLKQIDEMVKAGQINKAQAEAVKSQMGLR